MQEGGAARVATVFDRTFHIGVAAGQIQTVGVKIIQVTAEGLLVRLSMKEAEVEARERPEPFRNLRLRFVARDGSTIAGELYGKVTAPRRTAKGFGLAFTSVPPEIRSFLEAILAGSR